MVAQQLYCYRISFPAAFQGRLKTFPLYFATKDLPSKEKLLDELRSLRAKAANEKDWRKEDDYKSAIEALIKADEPWPDGNVETSAIPCPTSLGRSVIIITKIGLHNVNDDIQTEEHNLATV